MFLCAASNHLRPEGISLGVDSFSEGLVPMKSTYSGTLRKSKVSTPMTASSAFRGETSSSHRHSLPSDPTSSRKACCSPTCRFSTQTSDRHLTTFRSLNEKNLAEGRRSNALSISNTDCSAGESVGGSSDSWSLRLFSELVASSQRERWSFGYENMSSNHGKVTRSNSRQVVSPPPVDAQSCGVCSKLLKERSSWASQKISNFELSVVSVLVCGHVYHAECLESVTSEADRFDPSCPICTGGEKSASKLLGKGKGVMKGRNKISRNAVADVDLDGVLISEQQKRTDLETKDSKLGSSSSFKNLGRPFLRRHFSIGSRPARSMSDNEVTRKNFWGRHRRME
ncbi:hypothetical protein Taro_047875 [Colocasia esculenta]|uniref:RING-type domain-containing protein n=1 Tax=Colocasia esculenta TaxID=4460 RepID=A0A843WX41_COLES|nr:hypothetical protein [Colocasia esculenta]